MKTNQKIIMNALIEYHPFDDDPPDVFGSET